MRNYFIGYYSPTTWDDIKKSRIDKIRRDEARILRLEDIENATWEDIDKCDSEKGFEGKKECAKMYKLDPNTVTWEDIFKANIDALRELVALDLGLDPRTATWEDIDRGRQLKIDEIKPMSKKDIELYLEKYKWTWKEIAEGQLV